MKVNFFLKGGCIIFVFIKNYKKFCYLEDGFIEEVLFYLLEDEKNKFEYLLFIVNLLFGGVSIGGLYFEVVE